MAGFGKTLPQSLHQTLPATPALHNPSHTTTIPHSPVSLASCKKKELLVCLCSSLPIEHHIFCSKNVVYFGEEKLSHLLLGFFALESNYQYSLLKFTFRLENCPEMKQKEIQQLYFITSLKFALLSNIQRAASGSISVSKYCK